MAKAFSCEFCKILKNTFFYKTPPVAASVKPRKNKIFYYISKFILKFEQDNFRQPTLLKEGHFFTSALARLL